MIATLGAHLSQSTLFALAAAVFTTAFRKNPANVRYWLWLSASLKFFLPFAWLIHLGSRLHWAPAPDRIGAPEISFAMERIAEPFGDRLPLLSAAPASVDWKHIALWSAWACGFAAIALIRLRLWRRVRAAVRSSTPLDIPARVEIHSSPALVEPGVVGWLRPVLLLPEGIVERLTPSQLEAVLAHELCHVRRRDNLFSALHMIVEAIFWFHPLVWWIGARLVEERERACDEEVLSLGNEPRTYADAILNVCKLYAESPLACVAGVTGANLKRRIEAIMTDRVGRGLTHAKKLLLAGAGMAALAGPIATGMFIGIGHVPAMHAQSAQAQPQTSLHEQAPTAPPDRGVADLQDAATAQRSTGGGAVLYRDRSLKVLFFDFGAMTAEQQSRARQVAIGLVHKMQPADLFGVMTAASGSVNIVEDFTDDTGFLESAIQNIPGGRSAPDPSLALAHLETAVRMLGVLPQKKALIYFSAGMEQAKAQQPAALQRAIDAAMRANVAFYAVDPSGFIAAAPPTAVAQDKNGQNFGSVAMARTYTRHGKPDQVLSLPSGPNYVQTWRYNYLDNFHSNVEYEFTAGNGQGDMRIVWPPPVATFTGKPGASGRTNAIAGLPARHASMATYPAGEIQTLSVPLDSLTGQVYIEAQVASAPNGKNGTFGGNAANLMDTQSNPSGIYQANFILPAGSYVCTVTVNDVATGQTYAETIDFQVQ